MKRLMFVMTLCAAALMAEAQQVRTFHFKNGGYWVKVDLDKKTFLADGCGAKSETIKNYKKSGNKESFTSSSSGDWRTTHHEFVKKSDTDYTYTYWYTPSETKDKTVVEVTTKGSSAGDGSVKGKVAEKVSEKNPLNKVGSGAKNLFNKGKGLFKKDKSNTDSKSK